MAADNLRRLVAELRAAEMELSGSTARLRRDGAPVEALESHCAVLRRIAAEMDSHAHVLAKIQVTLGDRMNNLLMSIGIASDLLTGDDVRELRERLRAAVDNGRIAVSQIRKALDDI